MTALDITTQVRERLGDVKKQRWSDDRLLTIVSQGQTDICIETGYLRREASIPLVVGSVKYKLPFDCYSVKRVEYQGTLLPIHTRSDKDIPRYSTVSEFTAYKSNVNLNDIEVVPAIANLTLDIAYVKGDSADSSLLVNPTLGVIVSTSDSDVTVDPLFGAVTDASIDLTGNGPSNSYGELGGSNLDIATLELPNGNFGVTTSAEFGETRSRYGFITGVAGHKVSGDFGVMGNVASEKDTFIVFYVAFPNKLLFITAELILPVIWEEILIRYVVGTALQDDNDANNITRGEAELQKYTAKLALIKDLSSKDFSPNASNKYETTYRRV